MRHYQALIFAKCKCNEFIYTKEITICKDCGFKRSLGKVKEAIKKLSKKDLN